MSDDYDLPLPYDLNLFRGDTFRRGVRIKDDAGAYTDLTGSTPMAQIRSYEGATDVLIAVTVTNDPDQVANKGLLTLLIPTVTLASFPKGFKGKIGVWDLQITWPSGDIVTYLEGDVNLKGDVSHV